MSISNDILKETRKARWARITSCARCTLPFLPAATCCWRMCPAWEKRHWRWRFPARCRLTTAGCSSRPTCCPPTSSAFQCRTRRPEHDLQARRNPLQSLPCGQANRATSRTQSALLEAMEENQVTVDGVSHPLPGPVHRYRDAEPDRRGRHAAPARFADGSVYDPTFHRVSRPAQRNRNAEAAQR